MNDASSSSLPRRPLLSLVVTGRNDEYMGDFKWRFMTAVNMNARNAAAIGREHDLEIVVADWNSDIPLSRDVPLVPAAQRITRFIYTPPEIAIPVQKDTTFPDSIVLNTAIRRAQGEFIALTGSDVIYPSSSLQILFDLCEEKYRSVPIRNAFLTACRRHIPTTQVNRRHSLAELEGYISRNAAFFPVETGGPGHAAPTSMMLMHRDIWHECRGVDERLIYWGFNDIDLTIRMTQRYPLIHTDHYGVIVLHLEHWSKPREYKSETFFRKFNPTDNLTPDFAVNDENWGLGQHDLPIQQSTKMAEPEPVIPPGSVENWPLTLEQIGQELTNPELHQGVQNFLSRFPAQLLSKESLLSMTCLAWYAIRRQPRSYCEVGLRYPHAACLVSAKSPGTEVYSSVCWDRRAEDDPFFYTRDDTSLIFYVSNSLRQIGHWAYVQYVGGPPSTAVQRLIDGAQKPFLLDLILIRAEREDAPAQALDLAAHLKPGGAMVVTASNPALYNAVIDAVRSRYPMFSLVNFDEGQTGMLLAARTASV